MRKPVLILTLALAFTSTFVHSQQTDWGLSFTPTFVPAVSLHPGLQLGAEYKIADRLHLLTEFTIPLKKDPDTLASSTRYFRIKPEIRYSLSENDYGARWYTGVQLSYVFRKWKDLNDGSYFEPGRERT